MYKKIILFTTSFSFIINSSDKTSLEEHATQFLTIITTFSSKKSEDPLKRLKEKRELFDHFVRTAEKYPDSNDHYLVKHIKQQLFQTKNDIESQEEVIALKNKNTPSLWHFSEDDNIFSATQKVEDRLNKWSTSSSLEVFESSLDALYTHFKGRYNQTILAALINHPHAVTFIGADTSNWVKDVELLIKSPEMQAMAQFAVENLEKDVNTNPSNHHLENKAMQLFEHYFYLFPHCWQSKFAKNKNGEIVHDSKNRDVNNKYSIAISVNGNSELKYTARINLVTVNNKTQYEFLVKKYGNDRWEKTIPLVQHDWRFEPMIYKLQVLANGMCKISYGNQCSTSSFQDFRVDAFMNSFFHQYITESGVALQCIKK